MFMLDKVLSLLHAAAVKFTPNTQADENAINELRIFIKENPPLKVKVFDTIKALFKKGPNDESFRDMALDLVFDIVLAKSSIDRQGQDQG